MLLRLPSSPFPFLWVPPILLLYILEFILLFKQADFGLSLSVKHHVHLHMERTRSCQERKEIWDRLKAGHYPLSHRRHLQAFLGGLSADTDPAQPRSPRSAVAEGGVAASPMTHWGY